jgi:hypothetical protein
MNKINASNEISDKITVEIVGSDRIRVHATNSCGGVNTYLSLEQAKELRDRLALLITKYENLVS